MVSDSDNVDLVIGVKSLVELKAEISNGELNFKFLNKSVLAFPVHKEMVIPKERWHLKIKAPF